MIDPTVWGPIILKITAEQRYFLKKEFGITEVDLRLQSLQDVSELINGLASIAFYEFNHEHQRTERADCALNLVWLLTERLRYFLPGQLPSRRCGDCARRAARPH